MGSRYVALQILICFVCLSSCIQWPQVFAVDVATGVGRRLLRDGIKEKVIVPATHVPKGQNGYRLSYSSKMVAMAVPGVLILGCALICPCFQHWKKDIDSESQIDLTNSKYKYSIFRFERLSINYQSYSCSIHSNFYLVALPMTDFDSCEIHSI